MPDCSWRSCILTVHGHAGAREDNAFDCLGGHTGLQHALRTLHCWLDHLILIFRLTGWEWASHVDDICHTFNSTENTKNKAGFLNNNHEKKKNKKKKKKKKKKTHQKKQKKKDGRKEEKAEEKEGRKTNNNRKLRFLSINVIFYSSFNELPPSPLVQPQVGVPHAALAGADIGNTPKASLQAA